SATGKPEARSVKEVKDATDKLEAILANDEDGNLEAAWNYLKQHWPALLVVVLLTLGAGLHLLERWLPSPEGGLFDWIVFGGIVLLSVFVLLAICNFFLLWGRLRSALDRFVRLPIAAAYDRLPAKISQLMGRYFSSARSRYARREIAQHQL